MKQHIISAINFTLGGFVEPALVGQCLFMAAFSIGYGPVCWVLAAEIFPLRLRAKAMGLATFLNRIVSAAISLSFLSLQDAISSQGTFFLFAGISLIATGMQTFESNVTRR